MTTVWCPGGTAVFAETEDYGVWSFPVLESDSRNSRDFQFAVRIDSLDRQHLDYVREILDIWSSAVAVLSLAQTHWARSWACPESDVSWAWVFADKMLQTNTFDRDVSLMAEMLDRPFQHNDGAQIAALYISSDIDPYLADDEELALEEGEDRAAHPVSLSVGEIDGVESAEMLLCMSEWSMFLIDAFRSILGTLFWDDAQTACPSPLSVSGHPGHAGMIRVDLGRPLSDREPGIPTSGVTPMQYMPNFSVWRPLPPTRTVRGSCR